LEWAAAGGSDWHEVLDACGLDYVRVVIKTAKLFRYYDDIDRWLEGPVWARPKGDTR
jgi:hypothetical protein